MKAIYQTFEKSWTLDSCYYETVELTNAKLGTIDNVCKFLDCDNDFHSYFSGNAPTCLKYLFPRGSDSRIGQTLWRKVMHNGSNDLFSSNDVPYVDFVVMKARFGIKFLKHTTFSGWDGDFQL
jgi:hypothetical protein